MLKSLEAKLPTLPDDNAEPRGACQMDHPAALLQELFDMTATSMNELTVEQQEVIVRLFKYFGQPFLLALDLLDRKVITRVRIGVDNSTSPSAVFYTIGGKSGTTEVRLHAWNCSCAHFAVSAYVREAERADTVRNDARRWGGKLSLPDVTAPYCKHLLACALLSYSSGLFRNQCMDSALLEHEVVH